MTFSIRAAVAAVMVLLCTPIAASAQELNGGGWQCATFARAFSGLQLRGTAYSWWDQAEGRYERGNMPQAGAVMVMRSVGSMPSGHVATVTGIVDNRTITVTHANWSVINGRRGQIERDVQVVDVSANNDWSAVRVWYDPIKSIGTRVYPTYGFVYGNSDVALAKADTARPAEPQLQYASLSIR